MAKPKPDSLTLSEAMIVVSMLRTQAARIGYLWEATHYAEQLEAIAVKVEKLYKLI